MEPLGPAQGFIEAIVAAFGLSELEFRGIVAAAARILPSVTLVPAFGLAALPAATRVALGIALGVAIAPAVLSEAGGAAFSPATPWAWLLFSEFARGLPVALSAAIALYVASTVGGLVDNLRGVSDPSGLPNVESGTTPLGALLSMFVAISFLKSGGAARVASAVAEPEGPLLGPLGRAAFGLAHGIELAVAIGAPIAAVAVVVEVASSLVARAASPAFILSLLAPLRSIAILGFFALTFDRIAALIAQLAAGAP